MAEMPSVAELSADQVAARLPQFAELLHACVHAGASVNFVLPFPMAEAEAFWRGKVLPAMTAGSRTLLAVEIDGRIAGSVQISTDTPPNQPHRAEVTKLLVHPDFRRRGLGRALMLALEQRVRAMGRTLITFDTTTGGPAEPLYTALGYRTAGIIPAYSAAALEPGRFEATTLMYRQL